MALTPGSAALPSVAGLVAGIVGLDPVRIQCDGCYGIKEGDPRQGDAMNIILSGVYFNPLRYDRDKRRLCQDCRTLHWKGDNV